MKSSNVYDERSGGLLAIIAGITLGISYFLLKFSGIKGGLALFGYGAFFCGVFPLLLQPSIVFPFLFCSELIWRGGIFAITQILICESINSGNVTVAMNSSILGSIFGIILGRLVLKETLKLNTGVCLLSSVVGASLSLTIGQGAIWGILGGLLIGLNGTLLRALMRRRTVPILAAVAAPLLYASIIMSLFEIWQNGFSGFESLNWSSVLFVFSLAATQGLTVVISTKIGIQLSATLSLIRLPVVGILEFLYLGYVAESQVMIGMLLVLLSSMFLYRQIDKC